MSGTASPVTVVRSLVRVITPLLRPAGRRWPVRNEAGDAQREVRVLVCHLLSGTGTVVPEPARDAEAHLEDREGGERRGVDVEVACADAVGDDGAHRSFVVALLLAHPGPGRLGQARGVPVGDQRLAAMGGMPQGVVTN